MKDSNSTRSVIRRAIRTALAALMLACVHPSGVVAQAVPQVAPPVGPGTRVRITAPSVRLDGAVGTVQEVTSESMVVSFQNPRGVGTVERSTITQMEVSIGRERRVLRGLGLGLAFGAGGGVIVGLASGDDPPGFLSLTAEEKALVLGVVFGLTGGVVGLVFGLANHHDIWATASPGGTEMTLLPLIGPGGAGLHLGFSIPIH